MRRVLLVLAFLLALPVLVLAAGFVHGIYLAATGQAPQRSSTERALDEPDLPAPVVAETEAPVAPHDDDPGPLPGTPEAVQLWLVERGLLRVVDGRIVHDVEGFAALDAARAIELHRVLRSGERDYRALRLRFFACCAELPPEPRRTFAIGVGAVAPPPGGIGERGYLGEITRTFHHFVDPDGPRFQRATRRYCEVLESDEVLLALRDFGAFVPEPTEGTWHLRVDQELQAFEPETLEALRDAIDPAYGFGDRKYLREALADLAAKKRGD